MLKNFRYYEFEIYIYIYIKFRFWYSQTKHSFPYICKCTKIDQNGHNWTELYQMDRS